MNLGPQGYSAEKRVLNGAFTPQHLLRHFSAIYALLVEAQDPSAKAEALGEQFREAPGSRGMDCVEGAGAWQFFCSCSTRKLVQGLGV